MKKPRLILLLLIFSFFLSGCSGSAYLGRFDDYGNLLKSFISDGQGAPEPGKPSQPISAPKISGFTALFDFDIDYARPFESEYTFTVINSQKYFLSYEGELIKTFDIPDSGVHYGKYIFSSGGKSGLKNIDGSIILNASYDKITFIHNTALTLKDGKYSIFVNGAEVIGGIEDTPKLLNDNCFLTKYGVYDLNYKPLFKNGYRVYDYFDGMYFVSNSGKFGLISENGETIVNILYDSVENFSNGYAVVKDNGQNKVIDKNGAVIYSDENNIAVSYDGEFCVYNKNGFYGVTDKNFEIITPNEFLHILDNKVYFQNYIINPQSSAPLYSLKDKKYLFSGYSEVKPYDEFFIMKNNLTGLYTLVDKNASVIAEGFSDIKFSQNILMVCKDEKYYFYTKI